MKIVLENTTSCIIWFKFLAWQIPLSWLIVDLIVYFLNLKVPKNPEKPWQALRFKNLISRLLAFVIERRYFFKFNLQPRCWIDRLIDIIAYWSAIDWIRFNFERCLLITTRVQLAAETKNWVRIISHLLDLCASGYVGHMLAINQLQEHPLGQKLSTFIVEST